MKSCAEPHGRRGAFRALMLGLLLWAGCDQSATPTEPTLGNLVYYTAIGASDAIGFGGSSPCLPFVDCPSGTGYVQQVARRLQTSGREVTLTNLGIPGAVLSPETEALGDELGRDIFDDFLEREMPFVPRSTTLVSIFAGGNDANTIGAAIRAGRAGADIDGYINGQVQKFGRDMRTLLDGVRNRAGSVRFVVLNLPNLAALTYAAGLTIDEKRVLQRISVGFSAEVNGLATSSVLVIDLMCDTALYSPSLISGDGFHPNDAGYTHLADLVYAAASTGMVPAPRTNCPAMSQF